MTTTSLDRPTRVDTGDTEIAEASTRTGTWPKLAPIIGRHGISALLLSTGLVLVGITHGINLRGSPTFQDDEGTYVSQAWAVINQHRLAPYTYWYDHPPLGWVQLAGWFTVTGGLNDGPAVVSARWFALVCALVSAALVWSLGRRAGIGRFGASITILVLAGSPLAATQQRLALLDNFAMPWLLGAFVLALSPRRRMWAGAAAGGCFAIAVLTKETMLLFAPALIVAVLSHADRRTKSFTVTAVAVSAALILVFYPLYALLKGELIPGAGHVSLVDAVRFQLVTRAGTGYPLQGDSLGHHVVISWLTADGILPAAGLAAAFALIAFPRLRFVAVAVLFPTIVALRPGYLPLAYIIGLLPFLALAVGAVLDQLLTAARSGVPRISSAVMRLGSRAVAGLLLCAAAVATAVYVAPRWIDSDMTSANQHGNAQTIAAESWIADELPHTARIIVDNSVWSDLVRDGFSEDLGVIWIYKLDYATNLDPSVRRALPDGWRDCDYILETPVLRAAVSNTPGGLPEIRDALIHSHTVVTFGVGEERVELRQLEKGATP
ncbi:MAG: glycosyltransferase [Pseudonocardiales bacterium]|nr:glycosyltransferase [Pseudonocardiales bacterium]